MDIKYENQSFIYANTIKTSLLVATVNEYRFSDTDKSRTVNAKLDG